MTNQNSDLDELSAAELRQRLIASQEENKMLTGLFQTIIFELRTPLSVIGGAARILLDKEPDYFLPLEGKAAEMAELALKNPDRASEVIYDLLERVDKAKTFENMGASLVQPTFRTCYCGFK